MWYVALVFQVIVQNRYKLNKKCRRLTEAVARDPDNEDLRRALSEIKVYEDGQKFLSLAVLH